MFTHLAPDDYAAMLRLLRRFVSPDGRLFYTLFVNEPTDGGYGYIDRVNAALGGPPSVEVIAPPDFVDADPATPLNIALYSRQHAVELIDGTGWELLSLSPPDVHLQHHIVCAPRTEEGGISN